MLPYGKQSITADDIKKVTDVLKSDFLTQGPVLPEFEKQVSQYCQSDYAVAVNSATSALHIACLSIGLSQNDWFWTSPISFVASVNCATYCGAKIDFVDIDPLTYNMSVSKLREKLEKARENGKLPKIVMPVHLCGQSCNMKEIHKLSKEFGFKIIEDASHAIGGKYLNAPIGNCRYSDITVFSFHPVKIITTGEGGMALTNNEELAAKMSLFRSHGITRDPKMMTHEPDGSWFYQQIDIGFNYRMTDIQAALGLGQLERIEENIERRHEIANNYDSELVNLPIITPYQAEFGYSSYHLYVIRLKDKQKRNSIFEKLRNKGIGVNIHYIPIYRHPFYSSSFTDYSVFPESECYYSQAITLPIFPTMTEESQEKVISLLKETL